MYEFPNSKAVIRHGRKRIVEYDYTPATHRVKEAIFKEVKNYGIEKCCLVFRSRWFMAENFYKGALDGLESLKERTHIICNDQKEYQEHINRGYKAVLLNVGCLRNEERFRIIPSEKSYDLVFNSRIKAYKRPELLSEASKQLSLLIITREVKDAELIKDLEYKKLLTNITVPEIPPRLNQAKVGVILSAIEGSCQASAEYLLCGLPVVSTKSLGGRSDFYDESNSIICGDSPEEVRDACLEMVRRVDFGEVSAETIRNGFIEKARVRRDNLRDFFGTILKLLDIDVSADLFFKKAIYNVRKRDIPSDHTFRSGDLSHIIK